MSARHKPETGAAGWKPVTERTFQRFEKFGGAPSVLVQYTCTDDGDGGRQVFKEWVPVETERFAPLVKRWWAQHGGAELAPATVDEFLGRVSELRQVAEIRAEPSGKFWRITGRRFAAPRDVGNLTVSSPNQRAE